MASYGSIRKASREIEDGYLSSILESTTDLDMRLAFIAELLRDAQTVNGIEPLSSEIERSFEILLLRFVRELPGIDPGDLKSYLARRIATVAFKFGLEISREDTPRWDWPIINPGPAKGNGMNGDVFRDRTALKLFGYTVGKTAGWEKHRRERFLNDFMRLDLPEDVTVEFDNEYGSPLTTTRLRKVANTIASFCQLRYRNNPRRYKYAIEDWESDLKFLKRTFYDGEGLKFSPWPDPRDI